MSAASLSSKFSEVFGRPAEVCASAPGRANIMGEHVDYNDGMVLPFAIGFRTTVWAAKRSDSKLRIASLQKPGEVREYDLGALAPQEDWSDYAAGVAKVLGVETGLDLLIDGQVPTGAGLSSSAALECATAVALNELLDLGRQPLDLALAAQAAENGFVGMPCGLMDQAVSMLATDAHALLFDCRSLETEQIPLELEQAGLSFLVTDTRAHHALVDGGYATRRASCEAVAAALGVKALRDVSLETLRGHEAELDGVSFRRALHIVTDIARVDSAVAALRAGDFELLGRLLNESHASLRDDFEISCPELDVAVESAVAVGALGSRMIGGGFGGSAIALVPTALLPAARQSITEAFAASGFTEPRFFVATAAQGARLEALA